MTDHDDDRRPDEAKADELEREIDDMDEQKERLGGQIDGASEDWERKKRDERVPGATAEEDEDGDDDEDGAPDDAAELDFGRSLADSDES
jgi:hypothetical protein